MCIRDRTLWPRGENLELRIHTSHPVPYRLDVQDGKRPAVLVEDVVLAMPTPTYNVGGWKVASVEAQQIVKPSFAVRVSLVLEEALDFVALTGPPADEIAVRVGPTGWARSATGLPKVTSVGVRRVSEKELEAVVALDKPCGEAKVFPLGNPARLVVDLEGASMLEPLKQGGEGPVRGIRTSQFGMGPYVARVVFDLEQVLSLIHISEPTRPY